jgi:hypothetical protein
MSFNLLKIIKTAQYYFSAFRGKSLKPNYTPIKLLPDIIANRAYTREEVIKMIETISSGHILPQRKEIKNIIKNDYTGFLKLEDNHYAAKEVVAFLNQLNPFTYHFRFSEISKTFLEHGFRDCKAGTTNNFFWLFYRAALDYRESTKTSFVGYALDLTVLANTDNYKIISKESGNEAFQKALAKALNLKWIEDVQAIADYYLTDDGRRDGNFYYPSVQRINEKNYTDSFLREIATQYIDRKQVFFDNAEEAKKIQNVFNISFQQVQFIANVLGIAFELHHYSGLAPSVITPKYRSENQEVGPATIVYLLYNEFDDERGIFARPSLSAIRPYNYHNPSPNYVDETKEFNQTLAGSTSSESEDAAVNIKKHSHTTNSEDSNRASYSDSKNLNDNDYSSKTKQINHKIIIEVSSSLSELTLGNLYSWISELSEWMQNQLLNSTPIKNLIKSTKQIAAIYDIKSIAQDFATKALSSMSENHSIDATEYDSYEKAQVSYLQSTTEAIDMSMILKEIPAIPGAIESGNIFSGDIAFNGLGHFYEHGIDVF